jgi:N-acetylmuramoyl-L-alanine amidase CwlA
MLNWCSKIGCALKSVMNDIRIEKKVTEIATSDADLFETSKTEIEPTVATLAKKEPVEIKIHNPIYEYAHGKKFSNPPSWIVVHYTACMNVSAKQMCKAMKNNTGASSHFYIDEKDIYSAVPLKYAAWHVCGGKVQQPKKDKEMTLEQLANYKASDWRYDLAAKNHLKWQSEGDDFKGNYYSIGVDICVCKHSKDSKKATDEDWYFKDEAVENLAKTVAYLANVYKIKLDHIIRHGDATGKLCPQPFTYPFENGDAEWEKFKVKVAEYMDRGVIVKWV